MVIKNKPFSRWNNLAVFLVVLAVGLLQTKTIHGSWNESSRLAAIESVVERGTWRIDASPYGHETGDKLLLDGHYYSDKPPLFAAIAAIPYVVLHYGLGATLAINGCQPGMLCVYYWLTVLMDGIPAALMAALFYQLGQQYTHSVGWALALTGLLYFGTIVWPYSLIFNHHLPAAAVLFVSFYLLVGIKPRRFHLLAAGLLAGTAVMFDLTSAFLAFALLVMAWLDQRRDVSFFVGGALIPGLATLIFNYQITGGLLLPYFSGQGYEYPGSPFAGTLAGQHPPENGLLYAFRSLVGDHGLLGYCPLLILALIGLIQVAKTRDHPLAIKGALILLGIIGHIIFVLLRTDNFGGDAYGNRFFIPFIPTLIFFTALMVPVRFAKPGGAWVAVFGGLAALVSVFSAYQGVRSTWHQVKPPFYVTWLAEAPYFTVKANLSLPDNEPMVSTKETRVHNFAIPSITYHFEMNINDEVALLGYDLPTRRVKPGQSLPLTLYWQLLKVVPGDYFIFTHLLDAAQNRQGGLDRRLQEGYPIAFWYPGEIVADRREIPVDSQAGNGLAWLRLGGYQIIADQAQPLPLLIAGRKSEETSIALSSIFIGDSPQVIDRYNLAPQTKLAVELGEPPVIMLQGYDLTQKTKMLYLTLYWKSLAPTPTDWTTFVHLRDATGKIVAQKDSPPAGGTYPTSLWDAEENIKDEFTIPLERVEPGWYDLVVGMYDLATGTRLPVAGSPDGTILTDSFEVEE